MAYTVHFLLPNGEKVSAQAEEGETLQQVTHDNKIPLECACEGALACSTCHVILPRKWFDIILKNHPSTDDEEDMLDYAFGLTPTSRLGCQIRMCAELDGLEVEIPSGTRNMQLK